MAHTGAARAAVEELTREWAAAWAPRGIAVVAAAIGRFDTESLRKYPEIIWKGAAATVPLQRLGTMDEYAWLIAMLCSPLGRDLSGSVVTLDGALDDWEGPWPRETMIDERGVVPTEERKRVTPAAPLYPSPSGGRGVRAAQEPSKLLVPVRIRSSASRSRARAD